MTTGSGVYKVEYRREGEFEWRLTPQSVDGWPHDVAARAADAFKGDGYEARIVLQEQVRVDRPTWPETWMSIARVIAERSYDPRLKVGAIVVSSDNTQMLSGGYNGNYAGGPHEHESPEPGMSGFIHAEVNALVKLDYNFSKEKHMYVTHSPCRMCAKLIINAGIKKVVYGEAYRDLSGIVLLGNVGIQAQPFDLAVRYEKEAWERKVRKAFDEIRR